MMLDRAARELDWLDQPFSIESSINEDSLWIKALMVIPIVNRFCVVRAIKRGEIYLRPYSVNSALPSRYRIGNWEVRNSSQREDGVYGKVGYSIRKR